MKQKNKIETVKLGSGLTVQRESNNGVVTISVKDEN